VTSPNRRGALAYQGGFEAVIAILLGGAFGYWIDTLTGSSPLWLLVGLVAGFGAFVLLLVRLSRRLEELRIEEEGDHPPQPAAPDGWDNDPWDDREKDDW
jgi:F0F1-type ATP synthase assembly protein I